MEKEQYIFGASGHGKVVLDAARSIGIEIKAVIDDNPQVVVLDDVVVIATKDFSDAKYSRFLIAVGNNRIRKNIVQNKTFKYFKAIHKQTAVAKSVTIDEGTVVMPMVVINAGAVIGKHCIINSASVVEHDCVLEDYVHISPNVALAGNVTVGEGTHIGIGSCVIQGISIGKWATIGAGSVIINDVPDYAVVVGNPGRIIKYNNPIEK